jgi:NADH-quinone oxidoreductase subunit L
MEGPTPVSAMIHAATMVSAGVYLAIRFFPVLSAGWEGSTSLTPPMLVMAVIGSFTALFSATIAVAQRDVKRVLAYSTISQLGFMIAALGVGAYIAAAFHLVTHAIFKALLFLGSGSIIHGMEHGVLHTKEQIDPQDMYNMGGLYKKMPTTFVTFVIGGFALAGFPIVTAGFWSKDEILSGAYNGGFTLVFWVLAFSALLTAFYTMRQISLVFLGKPRTEAAKHAHETPKTMTLPLVILAFFAVTIGWAGIPEAFPGIGGIVPNWLGSFLGTMLHGEHQAEHHSSIPLITSLVVSLGGLFLGWLQYRKVKGTETDPLEWSLAGFYKVLANKYYIDEIYDYIFIRPAKWFSEKVAYQFLDQKIFDGVLHGIGKINMWIGDKFRFWFDLPVINKGGDNLALGTRKLGSNLRVTQSGRIQDYMVLALTFSLLGGLIFYLLLF